MRKTQMHLLQTCRPPMSGDACIEPLGEGPECEPSSNDESIQKSARE